MFTLLPSFVTRRPSRRLRPSESPTAALRGTAALFALIGFLFGSWAAVVPAVGERVHASHSTLGLALLCMGIGALVSMQRAGAWCRRWGPGRTSLVAAAVASVALALPATATSLPGLCVALLGFGAATGAANVAVNSLGVDLERVLARPLMPLLHAGFSLGGLTGALVGGLASGLLAPVLHLGLVGLLGLALVADVRPRVSGFGAEPVTVEPEPGSTGDAAPDADALALRHHLRVVVPLLGAVAGCTALAEGALTDWGSLHLRETLHAGSAVAALGYAGFSLAMAAGRLHGRRLVLRHGDTAVLTVGSLLGAAGMLVGALTSSAYVAVAGFVLVGLGVANVFPLAIGRAGLLAGSRGVSRASTIGYAGLLGGPPAIGLVAGSFGLPAALAAVSGVVLSVAGLALVVDHQVEARTSVASALRRQATGQLAPLARRAGGSLRRHADSLHLLDPSAQPG